MVSAQLQQPLSLARLVTMRKKPYGAQEEIYIMHDPKTFFTGNHVSEESEASILTAKTLLVKRIDLIYNN